MWLLTTGSNSYTSGHKQNILLPGRSPLQGFEWMFCVGNIINTLRSRQNGRHFADFIFKCIFLNENIQISKKISLKFVPKGPINNIPALVQIMAWRRPGDNPLSEQMMVTLLTNICVTRPQWVNSGSDHYYEKRNTLFYFRPSWKTKLGANSWLFRIVPIVMHSIKACMSPHKYCCSARLILYQVRFIHAVSTRNKSRPIALNSSPKTQPRT